MKKITFTLELSHTSDELFFFIGEFQRLADENKSFILCFKEGSKVYIKTCKELLSAAGVQRRLHPPYQEWHRVPGERQQAPAPA